MSERTDAERLDWLEANRWEVLPAYWEPDDTPNWAVQESEGPSPRSRCERVEDPDPADPHVPLAYHRATLREAIDAAMRRAAPVEPLPREGEDKP
jgi:hypothetical protein